MHHHQADPDAGWEASMRRESEEAEDRYYAFMRLHPEDEFASYATEEVEFYSGLRHMWQMTPTMRDLYAEQRFWESVEAENEAFKQAGGRSVCPRCGQRSVKHSVVYTLGYPGHPGAEQSGLAVCENCDYADLA